MLQIRNLAKTFGLGPHAPQAITALNDVDLDVADGEIMTVVGPSGCGKTTLLRSIAGFETPDDGTIILDGKPLFGPNSRTVVAHERGIGLVPQEGALFPHLTVAQNVAFGLRGLDRRAKRTRVEETLELVELGHMGSRRPHELSGGQQQRIALARAIAPGPRVILLDEPFSALDEYLRESLRTEVRTLLKHLGTTAVLVTHDQSEALALGDRVVVMREGRVVQVGDPRETYYRPRDLELARFLGDAVIVGGDIAVCAEGSPTVSCAFGQLPVAGWHGGTGACEVLIRPENIRVSLDDAQTAAFSAAAHGPSGAHLSGCPLREQCGLVGTVLDQTFYGHDGVIRVQVPDLAEQVSVRIMGDRPFGIGDQVRLVVDRGVCTYSE